MTFAARLRGSSSVFVLFVALLVAAISGCGGSKEPGGMYICPMHPEVVTDRPGECPICHMSLVPAERDASGATHVAGAHAHAGGDASGAGAPSGYAPVVLDSVQAGRIGLRYEGAERRVFDAPIRAVGRVEFDERRVHHVHARTEGYVEQVNADFQGKFVRKGEALASIYSPELYVTQQEYLAALDAVREAESHDGVAPASSLQLVEAARHRLRLWEVSEAQIAELERTRTPREAVWVHAPISGVVIQRIAYHGMKVDPEEALFDLVDLSRVWVIADVTELDAPRVAVGQVATITLPSNPGRTREGLVTYVAPTLESSTRTVRTRLEFENADGALRPGSFADVLIAARSDSALVIPDDSVLDSGTRSIVFTKGTEGTLLPREVVTGRRAEGSIEILGGLAEGDSVAAGASFLLDSESRLRAAIAAAR